MTAGNELNAAIARRELTKTDVADALGISLTSLRRKTKNECEFKQSEMRSLRTLLCLTDEQFATIFFA